MMSPPLFFSSDSCLSASASTSTSWDFGLQIAPQPSARYLPASTDWLEAFSYLSHSDRVQLIPDSSGHSFQPYPSSGGAVLYFPTSIIDPSCFLICHYDKETPCPPMSSKSLSSSSTVSFGVASAL